MTGKWEFIGSSIGLVPTLLGSLRRHSGNWHFGKRRTPLHFCSCVHGCGGRIWTADLWVMRPDSPFDESRTVSSSTGMLAIQSLHLPHDFGELGSVLPYRSGDVGSTDFDQW